MSENFENRAEKSEKELLWEQKQREVDKIVDGLGLEIDGGVKEPVVAFMAYDFPTAASCEGHIVEEGQKKRGEPYPWIDVCVPEPKGWEKSKKKKEQWVAGNLRERQKMEGLLEQFYKGRQTTDDARLSFEDIGRFGRFRIRSAGGEHMKSLGSEQQKQFQEICRKEIKDFAEFLKQKFLSE